jgi:MerR family copper efflux transcriptional regulator
VIKRMKPLGFSVGQMRELLDARDVLRSPDAGDQARQTACSTLSDFASLTANACNELREKLARGDEFVQQLRRESQDPRLTVADD